MTDEQPTEPTEILFNRGILMDLFVGKPTFQKKLKAGDVLLEGIDESAIYLGHKKLLPKTAMENLVSVEGRARRILAERSLEFPISGARFVQFTALPNVLRNLQSLKVEWEAAVDRLIVSYPLLRTAQLEVLDRQCDTLVTKELAKLPGIERQVKERELAVWLNTQKANNRTLYPPETDLKKLFRFRWRMFRISAMSGLEQMSGLQQEDIVQARESLQRDLQDWVFQASLEMHRVLGEAAKNASDLLEKNGKLNPRNLKPLFDAFETFKAVDFTGASTFQNIVNEIRSTFGVVGADGQIDYAQSATRVNETATANFKKLVNQIGELAQDKVAEDAGIEAVSKIRGFRRAIEI